VCKNVEMSLAKFSHRIKKIAQREREREEVSGGDTHGNGPIDICII
jgi:hypothetical protein